MLSGSTPGQLIPHDEYISASGYSPDGWQVSTFPVPRDGCRVDLGSPHVGWGFTTHGFSLTRPANNQADGHRVLRAVLGPPPKMWTRMTETEIRNDYFGRRWFNRDWLLSRSGFGVVTARQRSDHWFEVKVILEKEPPRTGGFEILAAITRAFSFMVGRQVFLRGYEDLMSDSETRHLVTPNREPTRNSLPQPLGSSDSYLGNGENYLGQAIDFFMTEPGEQVAGHLSLCWDTADNLFSTRLAMVSICVEGLLRLAAQPFGGGDPGYTPADRTAFEEWLIAHEACLTPRFISRRHSVIGFPQAGTSINNQQTTICNLQSAILRSLPE